MELKTTESPTLLKVPRAVWVLGCVSLLMDISSEMTHSLLPLLMVGAPGASALAAGPSTAWPRLWSWRSLR